MITRNKQLEILENIVKTINIEKQKASKVKFSYKRCFLESFIMGKLRGLKELICISKFDILKQALNMAQVNKIQNQCEITIGTAFFYLSVLIF